MSNKVNRFKELSRRSFDKKSANYDDTWDGKYSSIMYEGLMTEIKAQPFESILDVGCGTGTMLWMVKNLFEGVKACGIDFSEKMIARASELLDGRAELVLGDADKLPWSDNSFDLVICNSSFHHYPEPMKVLREMRRTLKPEGWLIIADPWWSSAKRFIINFYLDSPFNTIGDVRIYSRQEMYNLLTECGFTSVKWKIIDDMYSISKAVAGKSAINDEKT